jgi:hypothetical protein
VKWKRVKDLRGKAKMAEMLIGVYQAAPHLHATFTCVPPALFELFGATGELRRILET